MRSEANSSQGERTNHCGSAEAEEDVSRKKREEIETPSHEKTLTVKNKLHVATQGNKRIGPSGEAGCGKAVHQG